MFVVLAFEYTSDLYNPVVKDAEPIIIELYYTFYNIIGYDMPREDDVNDHWQMSFRYEIGNIVYSFGVSNTQSEVVMQQFEFKELLSDKLR